MGEANVLTLYDEYVNILSLLKDKPYGVKETARIIDINLSEDITLQLLEEIDRNVQHFNFSLNPFSQPSDEIIEDITRGHKKLNEVTSLSINLEKELSFEKIKNIDYIFFDKGLAINSLKKIKYENNNFKMNLGIVKAENNETELLNIVNIDGDLDQNSIIKKPIDKQIIEQLEFYLSNNRKNSHSLIYNPYSFLIRSNKEIDTPLTKLIKNEFYYTMLDCLSDKQDDCSYVIRGERNIIILDEALFSTNNYQILIDVFSFLISQKKYTEKYIIIKKVISLYLSDKNSISVFDQKLHNIWKTINHYYNHYIEDNIKDFFKTKDQLLKEAMNASKVIYEQTDKVSNSIIASILSVLIIAVTTIFKTLSSVSMPFALMFLITFTAFSIIFYYITKNSSEKRYDLTKDQFNHFINEISLIPEEEVKKIRKIYLENPEAELKKSIQRLYFSLLTFNVLFWLCFVVYLLVKFQLMKFEITNFIQKIIQIF